MPRAFNTGMAVAWLHFQKLDETEQMAVSSSCTGAQRCSRVIRANQIADVDASVAIHAVDTPAA